MRIYGRALRSLVQSVYTLHRRRRSSVERRRAEVSPEREKRKALKGSIRMCGDREVDCTAWVEQVNPRH